MPYRRLRRQSLLFFLVLAGFFWACEKEEGLIGLDQLSGGQPGIGSLDDFTIVSYTRADDSIRTDETSANLVGNYTDPDFGLAEASFYSHLRLGQVAPDFGTAPVLDSVVLSMVYAGWYGDTSQALTLRVFEVTDDFYRDSSYYSNTTFSTTTELGAATINPRPTTSVVSGGDTLDPQVQIHLDNTFFFDKIITASQTGSDLDDNESFLTHFKGISVAADAGASAILYFNLTLSASSVKLYYHNSTDTNVYELVINTDNARINRFDQDFSSATINLDMQDTTNGENTVYAQAMGGLLPIIKFPDIENLRDSGFSINKAELELNIADGSTMDYEEPSRLILVELAEDGSKEFIIDQLDNSSRFGGEVSGSQYTFNITRHIHNIVNGTQNKWPLALVPSGSAVIANRVILNGGTALPGASPMKLTIYYTKPN